MILASHLAEAADHLAPPDRPLMLHASLRSLARPSPGEQTPCSTCCWGAAAR